MRLGIILLLCASAFAQVQGNLPYMIDSSQDGTPVNSPGVIAWPENVVSGQVIICGIMQQNDGVTTYALTDNLPASGSWTETTPTTSSGSGSHVDVLIAYKKFTASGPVTISNTPTGSGFTFIVGCGRFAGLSGVVDGSVATATAVPPVGIGTINTSLTTTVNGDIIFSTVSGSAFGGSVRNTGTQEMVASFGASIPSVSQATAFLRQPTLGAATPTFNTFGSGSNLAMQSVAFKPSAIAIADTVLPDAGVSVAYSAQLHGFGGTAAQTYSCTGLPANGLSLNTSTGVISGSNPTVGTVSLSCTTTDGTNTSSPAALSINIGALGTPTIRQYNNTWSGDNGDGVVLTQTAVNCGDVLVLFARGDDTHGGQGWVQATGGTGNKVTDSFGSPVRRFVTPIIGNQSWPLVVTVVGPVTQSGSDTITYVNNQAASSGRPTNLLFDISGGNVLDDIGAGISVMTNTATGSYSATYTTVVPNTLLLVGTETQANASGLITLGAPFSVISAGGDVQGYTVYGSALISSPSSVTATSSFTGSSTSNQEHDMVIVPVRSALRPSACTAFVGAGEKIRRQIF